MASWFACHSYDESRNRLASFFVHLVQSIRAQTSWVYLRVEKITGLEMARQRLTAVVLVALVCVHASASESVQLDSHTSSDALQNLQAYFPSFSTGSHVFAGGFQGRLGVKAFRRSGFGCEGRWRRDHGMVVIPIPSTHRMTAAQRSFLAGWSQGNAA